MSVSVEDAFKDEGFQGLPAPEKVKALLALPDFQRQAFAAKRDLIGKADPTFAKLSTVEQNRALNSLGLGTPLKNAISKAARPALEMGGMMGGAALASPGIVTTAAGGALGYAAGHEAANLLDTKMGLRKPIETVEEAAMSTGKSIQEGAALETLGAGTGAALKAGVPALSQGAADLAERAGVAGFKLSPAQLMKSKPLALLEGILAKVPLAAGVMKKFTGEQSAAIEGATQKLMDTLGSVETKDEMGKIIQKGLESKNYARLKVRDKLFDRLTKVVENASNKTPEIPTGSIHVERYGTADSKGIFFNPVGKGVPEYGPNKFEAIITPKKTYTYGDQEDAVKELFKPKIADAMMARFTKISEEQSPKEGFAFLDRIINRRLQVNGYDSIHYTGKGMEGIDNLSGEQWVVLDPKILTKAPKSTIPEVKMTNTGKRAQELLSNENQLLPGLQDEGLRKFLFNLSDNNASMTFQGAKLQRERLNALIGPVADTPEKQVYKKLKVALDQDIADFAALVGGKVEKAFVKANAFHGAVKQLAEDPNIQKLVNANPAAVVDAAFKKNTGATEMMLLRKALPENVYQKFQSAVVNKLFEGPATNAGIEGLGSHAQNLVKNLKRYGEEPIEAALPAGSVSRLKEFADLISKINPNADIAAGNPSGTGSSIFTWVTAGGQGHFIINAVRNPSLATATAAGTALLTPPIMAKIYLSDLGRKLITEGFRLNPASAEAAAVGAKVLALARMEYLRGTSGPRVAPIEMKPKKGPSETEQNISRRGQFIDTIMTPAVPSAEASQMPRNGVAFSPNMPNDLKIYNEALTSYLNRDFSTARSLANKALKANPKRIEARRLIERLDVSRN